MVRHSRPFLSKSADRHAAESKGYYDSQNEAAPIPHHIRISALLFCESSCQTAAAEHSGTLRVVGVARRSNGLAVCTRADGERERSSRTGTIGAIERAYGTKVKRLAGQRSFQILNGRDGRHERGIRRIGAVAVWSNRDGDLAGK